MWIVCFESSHQKGLGHLFRCLHLVRELQIRNLPYRLVGQCDRDSLSWLAARNENCLAVDFCNDGWQQAALDSAGRCDVWYDDRLWTDESHGKRIKEHNGVFRVTYDDGGPGAGSADLHFLTPGYDRLFSPVGREVLQGPRWLVLDPVLASLARQRVPVSVPRVALSLGGSDTWGVTPRLLAILIAKGIRPVVFIGPAFRHQQELERVLVEGIEVRHAVPDLLQKLSEFDLAFTGGGMTAIEAAAMGLPTVIVANEEHEIAVGMRLQELGVSGFAGHHSALQHDRLGIPTNLQSMSRSGLAQFTTSGAKEVVDAVLARV